MPTAIFVHGTGGREKEYAVTFEAIENKLANITSDIKLVPCLWGELHGTKLNANGASIPDYSEKGGKAQLKTEEEDSVQLWDELYKNSLYEINLLSLQPSKGGSTFDKKKKSGEVRKRLKHLATSPSENIIEQLQEAKIKIALLDEAINNIEESKQYQRLIQSSLNSLSEVYTAIARAIVAQLIELCDREYINTTIEYDVQKRDVIVNLIGDELSEGIQELGGVGDLIKNELIKLAVNMSDRHLQRKRGSITDGAYPAAGDIIFYQAKGKKIRNFIREQIENVEPPVILLAHSLGGIACVDLLVEQQLSQVDLLVTVGSQAPFLYEIDALQSLSYGEPLPQHFPRWLNIYDLRDILSYVGNRDGLFQGRIKDVQVDNKQPFPKSHSAYWYNSQTWTAILEEMG